MNEFGQVSENNKGSIRHFTNFGSNYVQARNIDVWLPEGFNSESLYAVLYMHDGQNIFNSGNTYNNISWKVDETLSGLIRSEKIKACIVVGIWNTDKRFHEYTPSKPFFNNLSQDPGTMAQEIRNNTISDDYLKFITQEVKPFIDTTFNTLRDRDNTFIAGSSMGGLISIYAICEYPDTFGGAACMSTHWPLSWTHYDPLMFKVITDYLYATLPSPQTHKIYFDHGTETLDSLYSPYQSEVDKIMISRGFSNKSWITKVFVGDDHSELSWQKRFNIPATFLLSV
jgi:predicted alpha/beta superfamily hydrolase